MEQLSSSTSLPESATISQQDAISLVPFELQLLDAAVEYQKWVSDTVAPFLGNSVLEIGSGTGNMSRWLPQREKLVLTEAHPALFQILKKKFEGEENKKVLIKHVDVTQDWANDLAPLDIDTIISFNVLEHIEDDHTVFRQFKSILDQSTSKKKTIVSFVPAHQWAHGTLDQEFGHYRRYSGLNFNEIYQKVFPQANCWHRHFNLFGVPGWYIMGKVLKKRKIGLGSVKTFETICPWFRDIDDFVHVKLKLPIGQSILSVIQWES